MYASQKQLHNLTTTQFKQMPMENTIVKKIPLYTLSTLDPILQTSNKLVM